MAERSGRIGRCSILIAISILWASIASAEQIQTINLSSTPASAMTATPSGEALHPAPAITEVPSLMEQYVSGVIGTGTLDDAFKGIGVKNPIASTSGIGQFGYNLFEKSASAFTPSVNVPVGPDYVLGPGDEIRVSVWGMVEGSWSVVVDRDGNISLPRIGTLGVAGLSFKQTKELLGKEFSKYYSGFEMNVSMGALRTIRIYLVGNAKKPGAYTISSVSTLVNALFESGGPSKTGTMRDIQVKRNGETVVHFDMYDFLIKGDKTKDIRLLPEDIIFIAPAGEQVSIAGSVKNPAIYEMNGEMTALDMINMAGGLDDIAFIGRFQIERIVDKSRRTVFETDMPHAGDIKLHGGDIVNIFPIYEDSKNVRISGAVQRGGAYGFSPGMTIKDLISLSGGVTYFAFKDTAELTRVTVTDEGPVTQKILINLRDALSGKTDSNLILQENDYLLIRTVPEWKLYRTVSITGEVRFPGNYTIEKGEVLSSLIRRAGGFTKNAYLSGLMFTRESARERQQQTINEMVDRLDRELAGMDASEATTTLSAEDAAIQKNQSDQKRRFIEVVRGVKAKGRVVINLAQPDKLRETADDISLEEGDSLYIPEDPHMVYTVGSVYNQSAFIYDKHKDVSEYIGLSGNCTENADTKRIYIIKANGSAVRYSGGFLGLSGNALNAELESGDSIIVPEKLEKVRWLKETKDITQILYQIAVTAGVLIVAF
jgi:polysaccharide biosynthesis/export protein